jgi:hypothetical protein
MAEKYDFDRALKLRKVDPNRVDIRGSMTWFSETTRLMNESDPKDKRVTIKAYSIGKMYLFIYSPKLEKILPYYDRYPLVFPIETYSNGFLGVNMHYLPVVIRAKLMNALYDTINNDKMNESTKLKINYKFLSGMSRYKYFKPCCKRYLFTHVKSPFLWVDPHDWDKSLLLPTQKFKKQDEERVWADSRKIYSGQSVSRKNSGGES